MRAQGETGELTADSDVPSSAGPGDAAASQPGTSVRPPEVQVRDTEAISLYANFCRVTGTPEELILDFGLNAQPFGTSQVIDIKQRLVLNYFTAKRLLQALAMSVQRHEVAFGTLETDVNKRVAIPQRATAGHS